MKTLLTFCSIVALLFVFPPDTHAQFDSLGLNTKWVKGSIVLDDNTTLTGLVQFNDKLGMIKYKKKSDSEEESFVETSISAMQLYDEEANQWRHFAVFNINELQTGRQGGLLFEVLMEFRTFALLSRIQPVNIGVRARHDATTGYTHYARVGYEQFEHLCLVNEDGEGSVVLSVSEFEKNKWSMASKLKPSLNKREIEKYLGNDWDTFDALVKENKLNLKKRADFITAFELYRETVL